MTGSESESLCILCAGRFFKIPALGFAFSMIVQKCAMFLFTFINLKYLIC